MNDMTIDRNGRPIEIGDRVSQEGTIVLVNKGEVRVRWDHPEKKIVGFVLAPGTLEVQVK